jgi:AcrR family transcriptional regulator
LYKTCVKLFTTAESLRNTGGGHRERLLEAGIACLQDRGYARTTARDLVAASGTNLASIGYHFGSKERLLNEAMRENLRRWQEALAASAMAAVPHGHAAEWLEEVRETVKANRQIVVAFFEALVQAERSPELRRELTESYEELRTALAMVVSGMLPRPDAEPSPDRDLLGSLILAVSDGLLVQWLLDPDRLPGGQELVDVIRAVAAQIPQESA